MSIPETYSDQQSEQPKKRGKSVRFCQVSLKLSSQTEFSSRNFGPDRPNFKDSPIPVSFPSFSYVLPMLLPYSYVTGLLIAWTNSSRERAMTALSLMSTLSTQLEGTSA